MKNKTEKQNGKLIIAMSRALRYIHQDADVLFRKYDLTMAQFTVLEALLHKGDMSVGEIMKAILSTSGNMTVVIRNLEGHGLITRIVNPDDQRSYLVKLTKQGVECIEEVFEQHMMLVEKHLSKVSEEEKEQVIHILKKLQ